MAEVPQKRAVSYLPLSTYRKLMSVLALKGKGFSEWVRDKAQEEIDKST